MVNVKDKLCDQPPGDCLKHPSYGHPGNPKGASRCSAHKEDGMVDLVTKRCNFPGGCDTMPSYGLPGTRAIRCQAHKEPGMLNVNERLCNFPGGCAKQTSFGLPGERTTRCLTHKEPGMVSKYVPRDRKVGARWVGQLDPWGCPVYGGVGTPTKPPPTSSHIMCLFPPFLP